MPLLCLHTEFDQVSYASSLSSTPILKLKSKQNTTKPPNGNKKTTTEKLEEEQMNAEEHETTLVKKKKTENGEQADDDDDEEEEAACCLCHCGIDCSDRALFFPKDRKKEIQDSDEDQDYYFNLDDPYLPQEMYDTHNALVYCDSCDRMYHQKCHFVPILKLPQGDWNCLICALKVKDEKLFSSPPGLEYKDGERQFEYSSRLKKAQLWQQQLRSAKTFLNSQASNIRMSQAALDTLTSTKRNRAMILASRHKSQELAQTLLRMTTAKFKLRQALMSLEELRVSTSTNTICPSKLVEWCHQHPKHAHHTVPHGMELFLHHQRAVPRTREMKLDKQPARVLLPVPSDSIPKEIVCASPPPPPTTTTTTTTTTTSSTATTSTATTSTATTNTATNTATSTTKAAETSTTPHPKQKKETLDDPKSADDDSGITLDDLQCCICMVGESTDDNDVILCDGEGCYRAFHMKCICPAIKSEDVQEEDQDWFCPLCSAASNLTHQMQIACEPDFDNGEEEQDEDDEWDTPRDVFPHAQWEYETATKYAQGKQNDATDALLAIYLGEEIVGTNKGTTNPIGSDSEDESDYSLFDEKSCGRKKKAREEEEDDDDNDGEEDSSDRSSKATWLSSSVDMSIGRAELDALSEQEEEDDDSRSNASSSGSSNNRRRSRRLRAIEETENQENTIGADFDESNILEGKRRRKAVNYQKLNDSLFGKLSEKQKAKLDDGEDYQGKKMAKRKSRASDDEDDQESNKRIKSNSSNMEDKEESNAEEENGSGSDAQSEGESKSESDGSSDSDNSGDDMEREED
jgi:hypothetical protein